MTEMCWTISLISEHRLTDCNRGWLYLRLGVNWKKSIGCSRSSSSPPHASFLLTSSIKETLLGCKDFILMGLKALSCLLLNGRLKKQMVYVGSRGKIHNLHGIFTVGFLLTVSKYTLCFELVYPKVKEKIVLS